MRGRKVLLFFSEGFPIATAVSEQFRSVISAANSAGVTIYSIDVAGLRLVNPDEYAQIEKEAASRNSLRNRNPELIQGGQSALGRMEEAMGLNTVSNLDALSEETGGYTIKNTNDLADGLRRISEEMGSFYVLTYVPANQNFDGKYRKVAVKLARTGDYRVRARRGYYAFRTLDYSPVLAFELPLIERASQRELPQEFAIYAEALHFRGTGTTRLVPIYVELPVSAMKFDADEKKKSFSARYAILVLVKDENQQVVRKMGQDFVLRGPLAQVEATRQQPHLFSRLISLKPGRYLVEAVARDGGTGKMSGIRVPLDVPEVSDSHLRLSSVVLSRGVNPLTEEQKKDSRHPLFLDGQAYFVPNARETFRKSTDKNLLLHFSAYPAKASKVLVQATVELLQAGKVISKSSGTLGAADTTGRVVYVNSFPMENFGVGQYQLRVTVTDGVSQASSLSSFVVEQ
jgi:hypothetical protein